MDLQTAQQIYVDIMASSFTDFAADLMDAAIRYARLRTDWYVADPKRRAQIDPDRRVVHNSLIAACDILSRNMATKEEDFGWRKILGEDRQRIGDFACLVHCMLGLRAR